MNKQLEQLYEFHKAFGIYVCDTPTLTIPEEVHQLRLRVMREEVAEYGDEYAMPGDPDERLQAVAKELADIAYTLLGTVVSHGLQDEFERIFDTVHQSNMSKLDADGNPIYRADGKILKSDRYHEPDLSFLKHKTIE
jgi:Uncharacterized protein conserved in bacteria